MEKLEMRRSLQNEWRTVDLVWTRWW